MWWSSSRSGLKHDDEKILELRYVRTKSENKLTFSIVETTQMWLGLKHEDEKIPGLRYPITNYEAKLTFGIIN